MSVKKVILIKDCLDCPLADVTSSNIVVCESAKWLNRKPVAHIKEVVDKHIIPEWCPLPDIQEILAEADAEAKESLLVSQEGLRIADMEEREIKETEEAMDNYLKVMRKRRKVEGKVS